MMTCSHLSWLITPWVPTHDMQYDIMPPVVAIQAFLKRREKTFLVCGVLLELSPRILSATFPKEHSSWKWAGKCLDCLLLPHAPAFFMRRG